MKFKILTARSPEQAKEEIERFKSFCDALFYEVNEKYWERE